MGAGSNPAIGLGLIVALTLAVLFGERLKEVTMKTDARGETTRQSMKAVRTVGLKVVGYFLLTTAMIGTSMVAEMVLPPTHRGGDSARRVAPFALLA